MTISGQLPWSCVLLYVLVFYYRKLSLITNHIRSSSWGGGNGESFLSHYETLTVSIYIRPICLLVSEPRLTMPVLQDFG
jgi:hypothetical protein